MTFTFAFVDLAGFTALTEVHGDLEAADLVDQFTELTLHALRDDGRLVKTIGDAVMVVFDDPAPAVAALARLMSAVDARAGFPILRTGIHHGPAVERGGDYIGASVNLAARIAERARGGQALTTASVAAAARSAGFDVVELGTFDLRHVSEPVNLFEVRLGPPESGGSIDPVCRMWVEREGAAGRIRHEGNEYLFCSLSCAGSFASEPERFVAMHDGACHRPAC